MTLKDVKAVARKLYFEALQTADDDRQQIAINPSTDITKHWDPQKHGPALSKERQLDATNALQVFVYGWALWWDGGQTTEFAIDNLQGA